MSKRYEVHRHSYVCGPKATRSHANNFTIEFEHSHEGGDTTHVHPHTGPACYTIDKDQWHAATGLVGGGRKRYTAQPSGPQMERVELTREQSEFEIIVVSQDPVENVQRGGGFEAATRMVQQFGLRPRLRVMP